MSVRWFRSVLAFPFFRYFDFRLPPSLGKTQASLVLLSLLCSFRLFRYKNLCANRLRIIFIYNGRNGKITEPTNE